MSPPLRWNIVPRSLKLKVSELCGVWVSELNKSIRIITPNMSQKERECNVKFIPAINLISQRSFLGIRFDYNDRTFVIFKILNPLAFF